MPDDVAFDAALAARCNQRPAGATIRFFASGMSCGGAIALTRLGVGYEIRVNWLTGGDRDCSVRTALEHATAGFTLIEVLVALAVVAVSLAAIGSLIAVTVARRARGRRTSRWSRPRARSITGLPDRDQLVPGNFSGEPAGHRWRVDVMPFYADFIDPAQPNPGCRRRSSCACSRRPARSLQINTVRLLRGGRAQ